MIYAFLRRMYKYNFVSECFEFDAILDGMDKKLFKMLFSPAHCLHQLYIYSLQSKAIHMGFVLWIIIFSSLHATTTLDVIRSLDWRSTTNYNSIKQRR